MDPIMKNVRAVMSSALNKTAEQTKNQAIREIRDVYKVNVSGTRQSIKGSIYVTRSSTTTLRAVIKATGQPLGVVKFPHRQLKKGVSVSIKGSGRKTLRSTFVAVMESGHIGVFSRYGEKVEPTKGAYFARVVRTRKGMKFIKRQKIQERFTVSTASMFASKAIRAKLLEFAQAKFPQILQNQVEFRSN